MITAMTFSVHLVISDICIKDYEDYEYQVNVMGETCFFKIIF